LQGVGRFADAIPFLVWFTYCAAFANTRVADDRSSFGAYYQFIAMRSLNFAKGRAKGFFGTSSWGRSFP